VRLYDICEVVRAVRAEYPEIKIRINTNGLSDLIHGEPTAARLKGLVDTVSISLNPPDPEEYLKICRPKFGIGSWQAMLDFAKDCREYVPDVVLTIVGDPVTTPEVREKCKAIADSIDVRLRIRPYETTGDSVPPPGR
jgi:TatD family-associated radical SAM protein